MKTTIIAAALLMLAACTNNQNAQHAADTFFQNCTSSSTRYAIAQDGVNQTFTATCKFN